MNYILIVFVSIWTWSPAASAAVRAWSVGFAAENRFERQANADDAKVEPSGQVYAAMRTDGRLGLLLETGAQKEERSGSGSLRVVSQNYSLGAWGRSFFLLEHRLQPLLAVGVGSHWERVTTRFENSDSTRIGQRYFAGLGAGVNMPIGNYFEGEVEGRVSFLEEGVEPQYSLLLKLGLRI